MQTNNTITEIKNTLEDINSRISEAQEEISQPEDKMVEITSKEQNKLKRIKTEDSLRNIWDNIKCTNIQIIGVPGEEKKKRYEKIFEEITVEIFSNMEKEIINQSQEAHRVQNRIKPRRNTARHILIVLTKTKHKERRVKAVKEKQQVKYKGNPVHLRADPSAETLKARSEWQDIFKGMKGKNLQPRLLYQQGSHSKLMEK